MLERRFANKQDLLRCSLFGLQLIAGSDNLRFIIRELSIAGTIK